MNLKTLLAVAVFAGLAALVFIKNQKKVERGIERLSYRSIEFDSADSIEVIGANPIVLTKQNGIWAIPSGREAEMSSVTRALDALKQVESSTQVASALTPEIAAKWGVDEEQGTKVMVKAAGTTLAELTIGKVTAGRAPLLVDGSIFSVKGIFPGAFSKTTQAWLEKRLFPNAEKGLKRAQYSNGGSLIYAIESAKDTEGHYVFQKNVALPQGFRFDSGAARSVASTLMGLRVQSYVETDFGTEVTGLSDASDRIEFDYVSGDSGEAKKEVLVLGGPAEGRGVYAHLKTRKDTVVIPAANATILRKSLEGFRNLDMMEFDATKITKMTIRDGKSRLRLVKKGDQWEIGMSSIKAPPGFKFDSEMVERRISRLSSLKAKALAQSDSKELGFLKSKASVIATLADGTEIALRLGNKTMVGDKEAFYAKGNADDLIYLISKRTRGSLLGMLTTFEKKSPRPSAPGLGTLDPAALSKLPPNVREQIMQQIRAQQAEQGK